MLKDDESLEERASDDWMTDDRELRRRGIPESTFRKLSFVEIGSRLSVCCHLLATFSTCSCFAENLQTAFTS